VGFELGRGLVECAAGQLHLQFDETAVLRRMVVAAIDRRRLQRLPVLAVAHAASSRSTTRLTVMGCHLPPFGVAMPRALRSAAILRREAPAATMGAITSRNASARAMAASRLARASLALPSFTPRALAAASATLVRSAIMRRSCSANAA